MTRFLRATASAAAMLLRDLIGLGGAASVSYGAWLAYEPAGYITGGVLAIAAAWLLARGEG